MLWDVFCRVIDNFGDIGVCWRLCADLAARGHSMRLWVDDSSALDWMAPGARTQQWPGVTVFDWAQANDSDLLEKLPMADVWIEGFGCEIATEFVATFFDNAWPDKEKHSKPPAWVNLEYLSAESYVERCHGLPSPVMHGPAKGWTKHFYYPGFTGGTGGLLRESSVTSAPTAWDDEFRRQWLTAHGVEWSGERLISLFCYEPAALTQALADWMRADCPTLLLVTPGRAARAVDAALTKARRLAGLDERNDSLRLHHLPLMTQPDFDGLLSCCDLNLVRGEDSLVRALWAGKPFIWQIYPQEDSAHVEKLAAFMDCMGANEQIRQLHADWNGVPPDALGVCRAATMDWSRLPLAEWEIAVQKWRGNLIEHTDLASGLIRFIQKKQ